MKPSMEKRADQDSPETSCFLLAVLALSLLAFCVRMIGLSTLSMSGDSSYSVYSANLGLARSFAERIYDGHPLLYYYLLHFWTLISGNSELSTRFLSVFWGVLTVPLGVVIGRRLGGKEVGLLAALFITVSPGLVFYSRMIRMYSLVTFLALLSLYLFWRAIRGGRLYWVAYFLITLAALYAHYYTVSLVAAQAVFFLIWLWRRQDRSNLLPWLGTQFALALLFLPWLAYAGPTQVEKTAWIISHAPAPDDLRGFLEQVWISFNIGVTLDIDVARPLSLLIVPLVLTGLFSWWQSRARPSPFLLLSLAATAIPILLSYMLFLGMPYAVRPRFLMIYLPIYLALLAGLVVGWRRFHKVLFLLVLAFVLTSQVYALMDAYYVERNTLEPSSIMLVERLDRYAQSGDAVVFHAHWQIGYFKSHYRGEPVTTYTLDEVKSIPPP
ncbi:MAG: glycosyltransferase family 39 protein, partial [Chloroflexota bacterium]